LHILTYRVVPTSKDSGFLEMVQNAETLYDIGNIYHYITAKNSKKVIEDVSSVFWKSLAAYSVISYLLGLGDRHMENIMVTSSGILFHVDYGYILGRDPKPLMPYIRLTRDMIDAMTGHYKEFKDICIQAYLCLRRYASLFVNLLLLAVKANPPISDGITLLEFETQIKLRFLPAHLDKDAEATLMFRIQQSFDAISGSLGDVAHLINKEAFNKLLYTFKYVSEYIYENEKEKENSKSEKFIDPNDFNTI